VTKSAKTMPDSKIINTTDAVPAIHIHASLSDIDRAEWDRLANPGWDNPECPQTPPNNTKPTPSEQPNQHQPYNPFISWDFLQALEAAGCVCADTGWLPQHLILKDSTGAIAGAAPCYLKSHSQGEYVFDHGWADAFEQAGGRYYPKLQLSVPFTPVTGPRLLVKDRNNVEDQRLIAGGIATLCNKHSVSSAHLTFLTEGEWRVLTDIGFLGRIDQQFHWLNENYETFDTFLTALASRKRKAIRKERNQALSGGLDIKWLTGSDIQEHHWDTFYQFYLDTGSRKWGRPYLNRTFFSILGERMADRVLLVFAERDGQPVAGALNMIGSDTLYGRYWGCQEDHPGLHFEVCYYQAIEFAIAHKMAMVEAGAQGAHKLARGYMPTPTYSAHFIANSSFRDAIADYLDSERHHVEMESEMLTEHGPFKKQCDT